MADRKLGGLSIFPALSRQDLLAARVAEAIARLQEANELGVAEIDPALSDTAAFCDRYDVALERSANCVILEASRGDRAWLAACVVLADTRADVNGLARRTLDARKLSFAPMEKAVAQTGMEYGAITPIGLPGDWPILIDKRVTDADYVIVGGGIRKSKIAIPGKLLASLPNARVLEGLGQTKSKNA